MKCIVKSSRIVGGLTENSQYVIQGICREISSGNFKKSVGYIRYWNIRFRQFRAKCQIPKVNISKLEAHSLCCTSSYYPVSAEFHQEKQQQKTIDQNETNKMTFCFNIWHLKWYFKVNFSYKHEPWRFEISI